MIQRQVLARTFAAYNACLSPRAPARPYTHWKPPKSNKPPPRMSRPPFKVTEAARPDFNVTELVYTKPPQPEFRPGGGLNSLPTAAQFTADSAFRTLVPEEHSGAKLYKLLMGAITPRPVAFVSTLSADGVHNLAPFSFFNIVSADPPTIVVSVAPSDGSLKDTARNILDTKSFAVSIISEPWVEAANLAALDAPPDVDEFALTGLTPRASEVIPAPHVAEAAFSVEAELLHHYTLRKADGSESNTVFLGSVKRIHAKEFIFDENDPYRVLTERLRPVSRLGGIAYGRVTEAYDLQRQRWEDIGESDDVKAALKGGKANGANGH